MRIHELPFKRIKDLERELAEARAERDASQAQCARAVEALKTFPLWTPWPRKDRYKDPLYGWSASEYYPAGVLVDAEKLVAARLIVEDPSTTTEWLRERERMAAWKAWAEAKERFAEAEEHRKNCKRCWGRGTVSVKHGTTYETDSAEERRGALIGLA